MTPRTSQQNLPVMEVQKPSSSFAAAETPRNLLKDWQDLPSRALGRSGLSQKAAAIAMGKSESWLSRALRGTEKLGWGDLGAITEPLFWQAFIELLVEFHHLSLGSNERAVADAELGRRVREAAELLRRG